jgi:hypothetical protein
MMRPIGLLIGALLIHICGAQSASALCTIGLQNATSTAFYIVVFHQNGRTQLSDDWTYVESGGVDTIYLNERSCDREVLLVVRPQGQVFRKVMEFRIPSTPSRRLVHIVTNDQLIK